MVVVRVVLSFKLQQRKKTNKTNNTALLYSRPTYINISLLSCIYDVWYKCTLTITHLFMSPNPTEMLCNEEQRRRNRWISNETSCWKRTSERIRHWLFNRVIKEITQNAQPRCCQLRAPKDTSLDRLFATTTRTSEFYFLSRNFKPRDADYIWAGKVIKRAPLGDINLNGFKRKEIIIIIRNK